MTVWELESGGWDAYVMGTYVSEEAAVAGLKDAYSSPPYRIDWGEPRRQDDTLVLPAHFHHRTGFSIEHDTEFTIRPVPVIGA